MTRQRIPHPVIFFLSLFAAITWAAIPVTGQTPLEKAQSTASASASGKDAGPFAQQLAQAKQQLKERGPDLESDIRAKTELLKGVESELHDGQAPELIARYDELIRQRDALQAELEQLQSLVTLYEGATNSYVNLSRSRKDLEDFRAALAQGTAKFYSGDTGVLEANLRYQLSVQKTQQDQDAGRQRRLEEVESELKKPDAKWRKALELERETLLAYRELQPVRRSATEAGLALWQAKLEAARNKGELTLSGPATQTQSGPSTQAMAIEAENKRKLAEELALEARDRLGSARQRRTDIQRQIDEARRTGEDTLRLENSLQYWREIEDYELRRTRQANSKKTEADLNQKVIDLEARIQQASAALAYTRSYLRNLTKEERQKIAFKHRANAEQAAREAERLEADARTRLGWMGPIQETLPIIDANQKALEQKLKSDLSLYSHYQDMKRIYDSERQQIDQMVTTQMVIYYQNLRLATLKRKLADVYLQTAEVLVPTQPSFFERNKKVFRAMVVFLAMFLAGYAIKIGVKVTGIIAAGVKSAFPASTFSIKRVTTLASFAASIARLFIWIFGIITVMSEFGIDPAASSGAIGLVGLILAGMFQQIVVDFIKGLDIVGGRHYNVGDFVELDSKFGHVIDFSVKYTRIRTLSGQELNIPNSRCIPSRRFPEGYVDNYVDIMLGSGADVTEAKAAIQPVCFYLNRRLEPMKERPQFIDRFRAVGGRAILRYRVRVLPGCDWVVTDYFIPSVKSALAARNIGLDAEPKYFFINRIETFRKLFSRQLSEKEILQEAAEIDVPTVDRDETGASSPGWDAADKPPPPPDGHGQSDKPPVPAEHAPSAPRP